MNPILFSAAKKRDAIECSTFEINNKFKIPGIKLIHL